MIGEIYKDSVVSTYRPSPEIEKFTSYVKKDYANGHNILTKAWNELNDSSVIDDMNRGRKMFNAFVDENTDDPTDAWKYRGTRSKARNKGIVMHAQLTAGYILPSLQAQNQDSEIDKDFSEFMTDIVEWMAQDENSNYKENFLSLVFAMESDPVVYLGAEYQEVMQEIKIKSEGGKYTKKEILDEVLSGFKAPIYTADQILISNAFERNIQKHRCVGKRRWIEYEEAKAKYGEHENWDYVRPGTNVVYNETDNLFYDIKDDEHPGLVEEYTPMYRRDDTEVCFLGGVYMGNSNVDNNPIKHRDNFGAPRYNIQQFGFYPIGSHFFFYKSMMNSMRWDNALYDASTEIVVNRAILDAEMPLAVSGSDEIDGGIVYPNSVTTFADKDARISPLLPPSNLGALIGTLNQTEDSISESSTSDTVGGQLPEASQKAYSVAQAQANAKKIIGGVAKGLALSVAKYGLLMADIAINHYSIPQVDELTGDSSKLKYRKFLLENKDVGGKKTSKQLVFSPDLVGKEMTDQEKKDYGLKLLEDIGWPNNDKHIYMANPEVFAKMKYFSRADYKEVFAQSDETTQALLTNLYTLLAQDPNIDREGLLRELMYAFFKSKGDKLVVKAPVTPQMAGTTPATMMGSMASARQTASAVQGGAGL